MGRRPAKRNETKQNKIIADEKTDVGIMNFILPVISYRLAKRLALPQSSDEFPVCPRGKHFAGKVVVFVMGGGWEGGYGGMSFPPRTPAAHPTSLCSTRTPFLSVIVRIDQRMGQSED